MAIVIGNVTVDRPSQICGECGEFAAAGSGLAEGDNWYCRPCWDRWHQQKQVAKLLEQLPLMHEFKEWAGPPELVELARREVCKLMGKPLTTRPETVESGQFPPFVMLTGQGFHAMREGDGRTARNCFEEAVLMRPLDANAAYNLAAFFDISHMLEESATWVERVLELDPHHCNAILMKAMGCERRQDNSSAMQLYRQAIEIGGGEQATSRLAAVVADLKVCLEPWPAWQDCPRVLAEDRRWYERFVCWRENWLHPRTTCSGSPCSPCWRKLPNSISSSGRRTAS